MSQWLVTQGDNQFAVDGIADLKNLAQSGELKAGDMIQPPGASDWIYAVEVPDLKAILDAHDDVGDDDFLQQQRGRQRTIMMAVTAVLGGVVLVFGAAAFYFFQQLPSGDEVLIGDGGLAYSEMIVTEKGATLASEPDGRSGGQALRKNDVLELLAKRGDYYRARTKGGAEGWIREDQVIPMYQLGGEDVRNEYDPLYNPDRYVEVANANWMVLPEQESEDETITVFQFMLRNESVYAMTDMVLLATIKDAKGAEVGSVEIPVEGMIPGESATFVGTLQPEEDDEDGERRLLTRYRFDELAKADPDLALRYSEGVEVPMESKDFTNATIDIIELRAVPDANAAEAVTRR